MTRLRKIGTVLLTLSNIVQSTNTSSPQVTVKNGTFIGKYVDSFKQDLFLGIPYAQPPVGNLRLRNPQTINTTFGTKNATDYSDSCVGYGDSPAWPFTLGEDCLTINVIRPAGYDAGANLPVGVFIHGGGWVMDYAANGVYNLSFIVNQSVAINKPIIAVSFDYRLSGWGFLASQDVLDAGIANIGLKDQRLALHYIQENIAAFGGDPTKVVIWGESAGGGSIGYHATAFGGRDDGLFRGLISESGADGNHIKNISSYAQVYNNITRLVGCDGQSDKLACLRKVPFDTLNDAINKTGGSYGPIYDGDFIADYPSVQLAQGKFTKRPFLLGTNSDEGTLFAGGSNISSDAQIAASLRNSGLDANTTTILMALYPNVDALGLPATFQTPPTNPPNGTQYKRSIALTTDQSFLAWRRARSDAWSKAGVPAYAYHFDSPMNPIDYPSYGTPHFNEIGYVFYNLQNQGYAFNAPFLHATAEVLNLATLMCHMWISFIHDLDPNNHGMPNIPHWSVYNATEGYGQDYYLHPTNIGPEPDTFRLAGTTFINSVSVSQYGR